MGTAHLDTFAARNLPPREQWPEFLFDGPELCFPEQLNCASELLDRWVERGLGDRPCVQGAGVRWSYAELQAQANRIARVLVEDLGLVPGNRVLLRGANSPMLAACWSPATPQMGIAAPNNSGDVLPKSAAQSFTSGRRLAGILSSRSSSSSHVPVWML